MTEAKTEQLKNIAARFVLDAPVTTVEPFGQGHINNTFLVTTLTGERYVLQQLNSIFAPSVLLDIGALTNAMKERGFLTTLLIPAKDGGLGIIENGLPAATTTAQTGDCWRMLTYIPGRTIEEGIEDDEARSGMELIGKFHQTFAEHDYAFRHVRDGFHDTPKIMRGLRETISKYAGTKKDLALAKTGYAILGEYDSRPHGWAHLPKRIIHGDPKLNNIRFADDGSRAIALLDLDTMGRHSVVIDIADAARSWCNRADEGDTGKARFDLDIFRAMMEGYTETANFLTQTERVAIPRAIAQITLELSARFLADAYRESYFKLDRERYSDLFTQNSAKAHAQFALYQDIMRKLGDISSITASP